MADTLPPGGTRGNEIPKFARPLMKAGRAVSHFMFRMMGDRMKIQGRPLVMVTTVGAKTGKKRDSVVARFDDQDHAGSWIVVGSDGGSTRHPGWCYNLVKNPNQVWANVDKHEHEVRAELLKGAERDKAWQMVVTTAPGFKKYETTTDRQIPVFRLTPAAHSSRSSM